MTTRNIIKATILALATIFTMVSCDLETSDNGDLDGYWHLCQVDTLSSGGVRDMSGELIFWSVQVHLLNAVDHGGAAGSYLFRFEHKDNTLRLFSPCVDDRMNGDPEVSTPEVLKPFGVNATDETFTIEMLTNSTMILSTEQLRLSFRKL